MPGNAICLIDWRATGSKVGRESGKSGILAGIKKKIMVDPIVGLAAELGAKSGRIGLIPGMWNQAGRPHMIFLFLMWQQPVDDFLIGRIAIHQPEENLPYGWVIIIPDCLVEDGQCFLQNIPFDMAFVGSFDLGVMGRCDMLADKQLLVQFFAGSKACKADGNIA